MDPLEPPEFGRTFCAGSPAKSLSVLETPRERAFFLVVLHLPHAGSTIRRNLSHETRRITTASCMVTRSRTFASVFLYLPMRTPAHMRLNTLTLATHSDSQNPSATGRHRPAFACVSNVLAGYGPDDPRL